jgi:hypothetical protein
MKQISYFFVGIVLIFFSACTPQKYVPNAVNMPLLTNKNETQLNLSTGTSSDFQVNYAINNKFGIMLNSMFIDNDSIMEWDTYGNNRYVNIKRYAFDVGFGYYKNFSDNFRFELYGGTGFGKSNFFYSNDSTEIYDLVKIFLQPNIGFTSQFADMGFSPRFVVAYNVNQKTNETYLLPYIEPTGVMRLGYKNLFLTSQLGLSIPLVDLGNEVLFGVSPVFNVGIQVKLFKIYDKKAMYND